MQNIQAKGAYAFVELEKNEEAHVNPSGVILPTSGELQRGTVLSVGKDCVEFHVGEKVLFDVGKFTNSISEGGKTYLFIEKEDIFAAIK